MVKNNNTTNVNLDNHFENLRFCAYCKRRIHLKHLEKEGILKGDKYYCLDCGLPSMDIQEFEKLNKEDKKELGKILSNPKRKIEKRIKK